MSHRLRFRFFAHSWISDWNHGNAHFLRGLARQLVRMGHEVRCYEPLGAWSVTNLVNQEGQRGAEAVDCFRRLYPDLDIRFYKDDSSFPAFAAEQLREADVVIIHEWNEPRVVNTILALKRQLGFYALLHDTHHRAYTSPRDLLRFHLFLLDGVLAFGDAILRIYRDGFGMPRCWTFHEAADVDHFRPISRRKRIDVLWIGNWGDDERTRELEEFFIRPAAALVDRKVVAHGVRYPEQARRKLKDAGIDFRGYLPNLRAPATYAESLLTLHVPRQQYANGLSGVPTIRIFEALACGVPLLCSPWSDDEGLFRPGQDYISVPNGRAMRAEIERLLSDEAAQRQLAESGMETIRNRHTCAHRAGQLLEICEELAR
jgi:spore maturation protein CgeB